MNLKEYFKVPANRRAFWIKCAGLVEDYRNPLSDDVRLEELVDLWIMKAKERLTAGQTIPIVSINDSGDQLREALITALMEVE